MIRIVDLVKQYGKGADALVALDHLSLTLPDTGLVFILGKSGCGKSTFLNMLGGLDDITEGDIIFDGVSIARLGERELNNYRSNYVGIIYQNFNLFEKETVYENIYIAGKRREKRDLGSKIDRLLEELTLSDKKHVLVKNLSGGQKQRVAIARALIKDSRIILADEPTGNLDSKNTKMIFDILKAAAKDRLVVVVSHDVKSAETYADRIISLSDGQVVDDVTRNPDFEESENCVLDLPSECEVSEERIREINATIQGDGLEIRRNKRKYSPTGAIPSETLRTADVKCREKNACTPFRVSVKFLKSTISSFLLSILILSIIIALLSFSSSLIDFDEAGAIKVINETYDAKAYVLQKAYSEYDDPQLLSTSNLYEIGKDDVAAFVEGGYTGNVYPIYNISLSNDSTDKYEPSTNRLYRRFYASGGLGVAVVDKAYLERTFGTLEVLAGSLYGLESSDKIVVTDYYADSLIMKDKLNLGTTYLSDDPNDPYQRVVGKMLGSRYRIGAVIKTDYKEKYASLIDLFMQAIQDPQHEEEIRRTIKDNPLFNYFLMEVNTTLNYGYSVNPHYEQAVLNDPEDYSLLFVPNYVINDESDEFFASLQATKVYSDMGTPMGKGEMSMSLTAYNALFGRKIKADQVGFEEEVVIFKFHKFDETLGADAFLSLPMKVVDVYDNGQDVYQVGRLNNEDYKALKDAYVYPYALLFDDPYQCYELSDASYSLYYYTNLSVYSPVFTVCKIIDVFSGIFKFIFIALIGIAGIVLLMHHLRVIKRSRYLIGVYMSMGYPTGFFTGVSVLSSVYLNLGVFSFSVLFSYLTTRAINALLTTSFAMFFHEPLITSMRLVGFSFPVVAIYMAVIFGVSIFTFFASIISIRRLKPNNILHKAVE